MSNNISAFVSQWMQGHFESSRSGVGDNIKPMEGLRGFAVFLVFIVHYVSMTEPWIEKGAFASMMLGAAHTIGNAGVDLFFILSGYLIYGSLIARQQPFIKYMQRRIARIYPAFTAVFLAYVALSFVIPSQSKIPDGTANALLYLAQNFLLLPGIFPLEPMVTVAWSLSYELFYYLALPLIISVFVLRRRTPAQRIVFFLSVAIIGSVYCGLYGGPVRLVMFIAGILLYEVISNKLIPAPTSGLAIAALTAGLLCLLLPIQGAPGYTTKTTVLFACFFVLCLTCFTAPQARITKAFTWTPVRWLGNMSYSYYLLHGLTLKTIFMVMHSVIQSPDNGFALTIAVMPVAFAITLLSSAALFIFIERPFSIMQKTRKALLTV